MKAKCPLIILMLALALSAIAKSPDVAALPIKVGYPQLSGGSMPLWVINESKLDRRYGVEINSVYVPGGARLTQSLIAADVDIALTGGAVVTADLSGADLTYVAIGLSTYGFYLYAKPEVKEVRDLSGKILGVITKGAFSDHAAIALIRRYGMREGQDVKFLYFSRQEDLLAAMNQGIVPAGVLTCPTDIMAQRMGFKELVDIPLSNFPIRTMPSPPGDPCLGRIQICLEVF
jgi:NitT/TauT family transport system substrate-binding protein